MSNSSFDSDFRTIPFYQNHEFMLPFVGDNYESSKHKKLLLVGESSYMPNGFTIHHNVDLWYSRDIDFKKEIEGYERYCSIHGARYWKCSSFDKNIDSAVREAFPNVGENAFNEMASYNYFLRPTDGDSFKNICTERDREESIRVFYNLLEILKPDLIVLASMFALKCVEGDFPRYCNCYLWDYTSNHKMHYIFTRHPSQPWWWNKVKEAIIHGEDYFQGLSSKQFFVKYLKENWLI